MTNPAPLTPANLRARRDAVALTQEQLAAATGPAGITSTTIHRIETGASPRPHRSTLAALDAALRRYEEKP